MLVAETERGTARHVEVTAYALPPGIYHEDGEADARVGESGRKYLNPEE
jgi:hypothetical protein